MLHLLAFPEQRSDLLALLKQCLSAADDVVLLDEGLAWLERNEALQALAATGATLHFIAAPDSATALESETGLKTEASKQEEKIKVAQIDHLYLIQLSAQHQASSSWYP